MTLALAVSVTATLTVTGCGTKGPPLAPIIHVPAPVERLTASRVGSDVYVTVTIPAENIDATTPAAVRRVDVYAYTGLDAPGPRMMAAATLVASIPVAEVRLDNRDQPLPVTPRAGETTQGATVTVRDVLTAGTRTPVALPASTDRRAVAPLPSAAPARPAVPQRYYTAIGVSDRGRTGPGGAIVAVPLGPTPDPPASLTATYPPGTIRLAWEPAGGLVGFILDRELTPEVAPVDEAFVATGASLLPTGASPIAPSGGSAIAPVDLPPGPTRYNVYREIAPDPLALPERPARGAWQAELPAALNGAPLETLTFEDPLAYDGRERCYRVRSVRGVAPSAVYSEATPRVCVTPVDITPPLAPSSLTAEALDGAVTLLWDPNVEEDLAGYLVLRGVPGDATLTSLTERPVPNARYVDRAVTAGARYVYAVVAIDDRVPLGNVSGESNRVEVIAR